MFTIEIKAREKGAIGRLCPYTIDSVKDETLREFKKRLYENYESIIVKKCRGFHEEDFWEA